MAKANEELTPQEASEQRATTEPDLTSGRTGRDDPLDLGVPMVEGEGPDGPEDALALDQSSLRGDYSNRIGPSNYHPHQTVLNDDGEQVIIAQRTGEEVSA